MPKLWLSLHLIAAFSQLPSKPRKFWAEALAQHEATLFAESGAADGGIESETEMMNETEAHDRELEPEEAAYAELEA